MTPKKTTKKASSQMTLLGDEEKEQVTDTTEGTLALVPEKPVKPKAKRKPKDPAVEYEKTSKHFLAELEKAPSKFKGKTLLDELNMAIRKHLIPEKRKGAEDETTKMILGHIDHDGLNGPAILPMMRDLQQAVVVRPGFLKVLHNLQAEYEAYTEAVAG